MDVTADLKIAIKDVPKLDEWVEFCKWIETLPYNELITERERRK